MKSRKRRRVVKERTKEEIERSILEEIQFTEKDIHRGNLILKEESVYPINLDTVYPAIVYWIYSSKQDHRMQSRMFSEFKNWNCLVPENMLEVYSSEKLKRITDKANYPDQKRNRIFRFTTDWINPDSEERAVIGEIINDANNGHSRSLELREELAATVPGIGQKCASCFMIALGYRDRVPVDTWVLKFLQEVGYHIKPLMDKVERSPTKEEYLLYEGHMRDLAKIYGMEPALYQAVVWGKKSEDSGMYYQKPLSAEFPVYNLPNGFYLGKNEYLENLDTPVQATLDRF